MSGGAFKYGLEPALLTRQWALDTLLGELGEHNLRVAADERVVAEAEADAAASVAYWAQMTGAAQAMSVDRLTLHAAYASQLEVRTIKARKALAASTALRDAAIDAAMLARRGLDAIERHRDKEHAGFVQARLSGDFKVADEQWNIRPEGAPTP